MSGAVGERQQNVDDWEGQWVSELRPAARGHNVSLDDMSSPKVYSKPARRTDVSIAANSPRHGPQRTRLSQVLHLLAEDSRPNVYAGKLEVRPPAAPTIGLGK
jgi:hypothetical protein